MISISVSGTDRIAHRIAAGIREIQNPAPVLKLIQVIGEDEIKGNFRRQKNSDGSPWPRLKYRSGTPLIDKLGRMQKGITSALVQSGVLFAAGYATRAYNAAHNFGVTTKAHDIKPVNKKALFWPGAASPVTIVHHPGSVIPQREFMFFSREGRQRMVDEVRRFAIRALGGGRA